MDIMNHSQCGNADVKNSKNQITQHMVLTLKKLEYNQHMTIAQQLKIKKFPFSIKDSNGNEIYCENLDGFWIKREYDSNSNRTRFETSTGYWSICEYDEEDREIYFENSDGEIHDNRPKTEIQKAIDLLTKEGLIVDGKILKN
jgi:hypothetical protein